MFVSLTIVNPQKLCIMNKKMICAVFVLFCTVATMAEKQTVVLHVPGMECINCKGKVENVLAYERGVKKLDYDLATRNVTIKYEDKRTDVKKLQNALLKHLKYTSTVITTSAEKKAE